MKTGNKNQAIVLSVVAVLAIAFLVYQLLPEKVKPTFAALSPAQVSTPAGHPSDDLSLALLGNPFSHPMLATKPAPGAVKPTKAPEPQIDKTGSLPVTFTRLPAAGQDGQASKQPAESAGATRLKDQGPRIKLTAIMRVGDPVAMLEVDDQPAKALGEGDLIAKDSTLVSIGDGMVTIRVRGVEHQIAMGETFGSHEEQTK